MQSLTLFLKTELSIPDTLIPKLIPFYQKEELAKDDFMVRKGQACEKMYLIEEGYLRFFTHSEKKEITHWIFGRAQLVTDVASYFLKAPAKWNIQALTHTTCYALSYSHYQALLAEVPEWETYEKLFLIKLMSALENRVYAQLSMSAKERYEYLFSSDSEMFNELPLQYLASMLGMTPETLSRIRAAYNS